MLRNNLTRHFTYLHYLIFVYHVYQYIKYISKYIGLDPVHKPVHSGTHWPKTVHIGPAEALS
jgi:hypothetical protein